MGDEVGRCAADPAGGAHPVSGLAQADDSSKWRAGPDRFSRRATLHQKEWRTLQYHSRFSADGPDAPDSGAPGVVRPSDRGRQDLWAGRKAVFEIHRDWLDAEIGAAPFAAAPCAPFRRLGDRRW